MTDSHEAIDQIQATFQGILKLNPSQIDSECQKYFQSLEKNLDDVKYSSLLPKAVPYSCYSQIAKFLDESKDEAINKVISQVITCLSSDKSEALQELMKYNVLNIIFKQMNDKHFVNSSLYHLQTIANFVSDSNAQVSKEAHQIFSIDYIIKFCKFLENLYEDKSELIAAFFTKWLKCIYTSLEKYPEDSSVEEAKIILNEISHHFKSIGENEETCRLFCYLLLILIDSNRIDYNDFNTYNYPSLLHTLSKSESEKTKACVYPIIGKLILTNHYSIDCNFLEFLDIILVSNKENSDDLLEAVLFVCSCFFENKTLSKNAFQDLSGKLDDLIQFYEKSSLLIRGKIINLFLSYLNYISQLKYDIFPQLGSKIQTITNYMFDFIRGHSQLNQIIRTLYILSQFITYISSVCDSKSDFASKFVKDCITCMESLLKYDDKTIKEIAEQQLVILKKL